VSAVVHLVSYDRDYCSPFRRPSFAASQLRQPADDSAVDEDDVCRGTIDRAAQVTTESRRCNPTPGNYLCRR
jgi:hypothetical protein